MQKKKLRYGIRIPNARGTFAKSRFVGNYRLVRRGKCRDKCGGVFHAAVMTPYKKRLHANLLN